MEIYAGIDLGGTAIKGSIAGRDGTILADDTIATESHLGPEGVLERMAGLVNRLAARCSARPAAMGIGVPGLIDLAHGVTKFLPNFPTHWRDVPVAAILEKQLGYPVFLLNDVRTATLGELTYGHGRQAENMVFYTIGTGIGGGVVIDGKLRLGPLARPASWGITSFKPTAPVAGAATVAASRPWLARRPSPPKGSVCSSSARRPNYTIWSAAIRAR